MKQSVKLAAASALTLALAGTSAMAQTTITGIQQLDDQIDDVQIQAQRDLERAGDRARFGQPGVGADGWTGSVALTFSGNTGNTETQDLALAGRFGLVDGPWSHTFGFGLEYGEDNNSTTKEKAFAIIDSNYSLTPEFYVFGLGRWERDNFADTRDAFVGIGPGYRIINTPDVAWRVQAGPGWRSNRTGDARTDEVALIASSRLFFRVNEGVFITNDTDVLHSDVNTLTTNDLGLNVAMTEGLATRISLRTDYNTDPAPDRRNTDNTIGVSLVYSFR
ncbi:YdiY family protein [Plastorhodobacter daqingensis]|uniref:YdiY family protein n=1 Tax=Plastorhodobacter daqingensis TaxID=1387281 RepID=A0ABW2UKD5_9RHOB